MLRKGNWVWEKIRNQKLVETRLQNAARPAKSFKQQDLDARTEFFGKSIFDKETP